MGTEQASSFWPTTFGSNSESNGKRLSQFKLHVTCFSLYIFLEIHAWYHIKLFNIPYHLI